MSGPPPVLKTASGICAGRVFAQVDQGGGGIGGRTLATMLWSCPCPDSECPPTDVKPIDVTSLGDVVRMSVCGGACGMEHPTDSFKRV
jgi:hypothetical protein